MNMTAPKSNITKRAHYIPQVYSRNFCTDGSNPSTGYLYAKSRSDETPIPVQPKDFGLKNYYYAFEKEDGTRDTQTMEALFQVGEDDWPNLLAVFERGLELYPEHIDNICTFLATMRIRVPNFRMQMEERRAEGARVTGMVLGKHDKEINRDFQERLEAARKRGDEKAVASLLQVKEDFDRGKLEIAVDPQTSIQSIQHIQKLHDEFLKLNWAVMQNTFDQEFVTTDNPVVHFDLEQREPLIPYQNGIAARGVEVTFPMTKRLMLIGNRFFPSKFGYATIKKVEKITQLNRRLIMSAEQYIFSGQPRFQRLVKEYANIAPRTKFTHLQRDNGMITVSTATLGPPHNLLKWKKEKNE